MEHEKLENKFINATKWSAITEVTAKTVIPITNMILARIISPEAFGVVATVTMIVSFTDMFTDAGFQKYLVQHEFNTEEQKYKNANVAFLTNFGLSLFLWIVIIMLRNQIAVFVGNPSLGNVVAIASVQLLFTSFSSIQMALYRRDFDFKTMFLARIVAICIPFVVTIPLALLGFSYWSLIIGTVFIQISNAVVLTVKSKWKPQLYYKFEILKEMISFSIWSLVEAISIWFTIWVDAFIIGSFLNQYYLGIYMTSTVMVNSLMSLITAAVVPVLFSALSRLQSDPAAFNRTYFKAQKMVSILVFPLGIGVFLYSDLATQILLGDQWYETSDIIGIWALTSAIMIVFGHLCSEVYRSKGKPRLSFLAQMLHLGFLIPVCIISAKYGFWSLVYARSGIRLQSILVDFSIMKFSIGIPIGKTFRNVASTALSSIAMGVFGTILKSMNEGLTWDMISIILCIVFYFAVLSLFPSMRKEMKSLLWKLKPNMGKTKNDITEKI